MSEWANSGERRTEGFADSAEPPNSRDERPTGRDAKGRFRKGQSGNPRGRKPKYYQTPSDLMMELCTQPVTVTIQGRQQKVPRQVAVIIDVINAVFREPSAANKVRLLKDLKQLGYFDLARRYEEDREQYEIAQVEHNRRVWAAVGAVVEKGEIETRACALQESGRGRGDNDAPDEDGGAPASEAGFAGAKPEVSETGDLPLDEELDGDSELAELYRRYQEATDRAAEAEAALRRFERQVGRFPVRY